MAGLGSKGQLDRSFGAREPAADLLDGGAGRDAERGIAHQLLPCDVGAGEHGAHGRQQRPFRPAADTREQSFRVLAGERPKLEFEAALLGHDVERAAAGDDACAHRAMGRLEVGREWTLGAKLERYDAAAR